MLTKLGENKWRDIALINLFFYFLFGWNNVVKKKERQHTRKREVKER